MPELPEVETVRRRLAPLLEGRRFAHVEIADPRLTRPHDRLETARELEGERVTVVDRRGKYLIFRFESGRALLIHLRMTGSLRHLTTGHTTEEMLPEDPHRRAVVTLDDGSAIAYRDVRRFGTWLLVEPSELDGYLADRVGPEPLARSYRARDLAERLHGRRAPIKAALLDQHTVAGVGNIYADEALWRAGVHPLTPAANLSPEEAKAVHGAVRAVLNAGIRRQGSTLRDYRLPDGSSGTAQDRFNVYGRAGSPCARCGTPIDKIRVAGRGTWYCPTCQVYRNNVRAESNRYAESTRYAAASSASSRPSRSSRQSSV